MLVLETITGLASRFKGLTSKTGMSSKWLAYLSIEHVKMFFSTSASISVAYLPESTTQHTHAHTHTHTHTQYAYTDTNKIFTVFLSILNTIPPYDGK